MHKAIGVTLEEGLAVVGAESARIFHDLLHDLLSKGETACIQVKEVCETGIAQLQSIDFCELDSWSAQILDDAVCAFSSLLALLVVSLDTKTEAWSIH